MAFNPYGDEEDAILTREWRAGTMVKIIARMLPGRSTYSIRNRRKRLNLPGRTRKDLGADKVIVSVHLSKADHDKLQALCAARGKPVGKYIRRLVQRDIHGA